MKSVRTSAVALLFSVSAGALAAFLKEGPASSTAGPPGTREPGAPATLAIEDAGGAAPAGAGGLSRLDGLQLEAYRAMFERLLAEGSTGSKLWIARVAGKLSLEQACELFGFFTGGQERDGGRGPGWGAVVESLSLRIASLDPRRGVKLAGVSENAMLLVHSLVALARTDGGGALQAFAGAVAAASGGEALPSWMGSPEGLLNQLRLFEQNWGLEVGGSVPAMLEEFRQSPLLQKQPFARFLLGGALARAHHADPGGAVETLQSVAAALAEPEKAAAFTQVMAADILSRWRTSAPEAASVFLENLPDRAKPFGSTGAEARARFQRQGLDAAISFAEAQTEGARLSEAAEALWSAYASKEPAAALAWVAQLPEGEFKSGVLDAAFTDLWHKTGGWFPDVERILRLISEMPPSRTKLDFLARALWEDSMISDSSSMDRIESLKLSQAEKDAVIRRMAPIRKP